MYRVDGDGIGVFDAENWAALKRLQNFVLMKLGTERR
jgi:hypothetical protein